MPNHVPVLDCVDDDVLRYTVEEIDGHCPRSMHPDSIDVSSESKVAAHAREVLSRFRCCQPGYAAAAAAAAASVRSTNSGGGGNRHHYNRNAGFGGSSSRPQKHDTHQQQPQQQQVDCWITAGRGDRRRFRAPPGGGGASSNRRTAPRSFIGGSGGDAGARSLLGALNKLNERNFDAIQSRVCELIEGGSVEGNSAARAIISKSCDDATYAPTFARLLAAISTRSELAISEVLSLVTDLFGGDLASEIGRVAIAIDSPLATPESGYDAFCSALRGKRRLLGRTSTAFAVISLMAPDLSALAKKTEQKFPRPPDVVSAIVDAIRTASASETAVDIALDIASQLLAMLGTSQLAAHVAAIASLRTGIREATATASEEGSPKIRFKIQDVLQEQKTTTHAPRQNQSHQHQQHPQHNQRQDQQRHAGNTTSAGEASASRTPGRKRR